MQSTFGRTFYGLVLFAATVSAQSVSTSASATTVASAISQTTPIVNINPNTSTNSNSTSGGVGNTGGDASVGIYSAGGFKALTWNIDYVENVVRANYSRRMIGVNGTWPIPIVVLNFNDTFSLTVVNNLDKAVSIHHHGIFQYGTVQMDGPGMVTQCPIPPGGTYTYTFPLLQWGTYWIHAHWLGEYVDGLRAPLVINPPPSIQLAPFDDEFVVSISDFYNVEQPVALAQFLGIYNPSGAEPVPNAGLLNELDNPDQIIVPGKTYKVRFVSMATLVTYDIYIEGHDMYVVEIDGVDVEPSLQSSFSIGPAQRTAVIFKAREAGNGTEVNYLLHAVMESSMFENAPANLVYDVTMPFIYNTSASAQMYSATAPDFNDIMNELDLVPLAVLEALPTPDPKNSFLLEAGFQVYSDGTNHGAFNNTPYVMPVVAPLYTMETIGSQYVDNPAVYGASAMVVSDFGDSAEIIISNTDSGKHPFHLHGHSFQLIYLSNNTFDPSNPYPEKIAANPVRRDVVNVPGGGYAIFRFTSTNPGVWLFHCHIEWHLEAGLAALLIEAPSLVTNTIDSTMKGFCDAQGIRSSGNAAGNLALDMSGQNLSPSVLPDYITARGWGAMVGCAISSFVGVATVIWFSKKDSIDGHDVLPATFNVVHEQHNSNMFKETLDLCNEDDAEQLRRYMLSHSISNKIIHCLNNAIDNYGNTVLHVAVAYRDLTLAAIFLIKGADPNKENRSGVSPTCLALRLFGHEHKLTQHLSSQGGKLSQDEFAKSAKRLHFFNKNSLFAPHLNQMQTQALLVSNEKCDFMKSAKSMASNSCWSRIQNRVLTAIPKNKLNPHSAAYLNSNLPSITPLMKAAFKGHLSLIERFVDKNSDIDLVDARGLSALSYACYSGNFDVVRYFVETVKAKINCSLAGSENEEKPFTQKFTPTPLILAVINGHRDIVKYLIERGAIINMRIGPAKGYTALMIACWLRKLDMVKLLLSFGAELDSETESWVKIGVQKLKKISSQLYQTDWEIDGWQIKYKSCYNIKKQVTRRDQIFLLSADDMEEVAKILRTLQSKSNSLGTTSPTMAECEINGHRNIFLPSEIEIGQERLDLTENLPVVGTELDQAYMNLYKCIIQLAIAANKHEKTTYVVISAKSIQHSNTILRHIEEMNSSVWPSKDTQVPISPHFSAGASQKLFETSLFANSFASEVLSHQAKTLKAEYQESLVLTTKLACGIWPPSSAVTDMIQAASNLSKAAKSLVDLANCFGYFPLLEKPLIFQMDQMQEKRFSKEIEESHTAKIGKTEEDTFKKWPRPNLLNYEKYKSINDFLNMERLSKKINELNEVVEVEPKTRASDLEYFNALEQKLKEFVISVNELKKLQTQKRQDRYILGTRIICARAYEIIQEIQGFELFVDFADSFDSVLLAKEDVENIEKLNINLGVTDFPVSALYLLELTQEEVIECSDRVQKAGTEASFVWATRESEFNMLQSCIPCVKAVKKLFAVAKAVAINIRECWEGDFKRRQEWNRKTTQNENIQALFEAWRGNISDQSEQYNIANLKLDEPFHSLIFDTKLKFLKGGQISEIVAFITSHNNYDIETAHILILCHHSFMTSVDLLKQLIHQYENIIPPSNLSEREFNAWIKIKNELLLGGFRDFIEKVVLTDWEVDGRLILSEMETRIAKYGIAVAKTSVIKTMPKAFSLFSEIDPNVLFFDSTRILELDPLEFAKQITLLEFEIFLLMRPSECLDQIWSSKLEKERSSARLEALTRKMPNSRKISKEFVSAADSAISKMISHTNNKCRELKNYNGVTGIVSGLSMAPIARLHRTWKKFSKRYSTIYNEYEETADIVSPRGQYSNYRKELKDVKLPAVPFLGLGVSTEDQLYMESMNIEPKEEEANGEEEQEEEELQLKAK
ncbi:hypothetical protein HK100_002936 [Physocladia obscura]|uniref:Ras-GEF domain-containing protein n=1 Tax=Physocladia obscura TaxID=109957 RepID=A0AAD5XMS8_9FUNG|nr:hypothetical protein HK100_002936 [Physocladia obscura]